MRSTLCKKTTTLKCLFFWPVHCTGQCIQSYLYSLSKKHSLFPGNTSMPMENLWLWRCIRTQNQQRVAVIANCWSKKYFWIDALCDVTNAEHFFLQKTEQTEVITTKKTLAFILYWPIVFFPKYFGTLKRFSVQEFFSSWEIIKRWRNQYRDAS